MKNRLAGLVLMTCWQQFQKHFELVSRNQKKIDNKQLTKTALDIEINSEKFRIK